MDNLYKGLLLAAAPNSAFFFGDTANGKTIDAVAGSIATWSSGPSAPSVVGPSAPSTLDPLGLGYVDTTNGAYATVTKYNGVRPCEISKDSGFEVVFKMLQYPTAPAGDESCIVVDMGTPVGQDKAFFLQVMNKGGLRSIRLTDDSSATVIDAIDGNYVNKLFHVFCKRSAAGLKTLFVNGVMIGSSASNSSNGPNWSINCYTPQNLLYIGQMQIAVLANFGRDVTAEEISDRAACVARTHMLGGAALLDNSQAASEIRIRRVSDRKHIGAITPAPDGSWSCHVPPGTYEVLALGPAGYRPVCDSPVAAVAT